MAKDLRWSFPSLDILLSSTFTVNGSAVRYIPREKIIYKVREGPDEELRNLSLDEKDPDWGLWDHVFP